MDLWKDFLQLKILVNMLKMLISFHINILLATSRGVGQQQNFDRAFVQRGGGGGVKGLVNKYQPPIKAIVRANPNTPVMVYLMAGINDLTHMAK